MIFLTAGGNSRNGMNRCVRHEVARVKWMRRWEAVVTVT
jgi:hypothetical protein